MHKLPKYLSFILLLLLLPYYITAQQNWTLEKCLSHALENNIQIKQQRLNSEIKALDLIQSKAALIPTLNASGSHTYNFGRTIDMYTNDFATSRVQSNNFYVSTGMTIFNGFQLLNTVKQNKLERDAAMYDTEKMQNDISLAIATAYLQVLFNYEYLDIKAAQLDISKQQTTQTQKLVEAGALPQSAFYSIEAQLAAEELQYVNAENMLNMSYLTLTQLLDLPTIEGFTIYRPAIEVEQFSLPALSSSYIYNTALQLQPEIKSAELKVKSALTGLSIARSYGLPSISLRGSYGTGYSGASREIVDFFVTGQTPIGFTESLEIVYGPSIDYITQVKPFKEQLNDNLNSSLGFYLNIPIFNNLQSRTAISKSRILIENANYNLQNTKNQLNKDIQQAYADAVSAYNRYMASQKAVIANETSYNYMEQRYALGMLNIIEYNDAKVKLDNARSELLQSKYEYVFRIKILDFYMGKPIEIK